jgi:hypothetical protein
MVHLAKPGGREQRGGALEERLRRADQHRAHNLVKIWGHHRAREKVVDLNPRAQRTPKRHQKSGTDDDLSEAKLSNDTRLEEAKDDVGEQKYIYQGLCLVMKNSVPCA